MGYPTSAERVELWEVGYPGVELTKTRFCAMILDMIFRQKSAEKTADFLLAGFPTYKRKNYGRSGSHYYNLLLLSRDARDTLGQPDLV